MPCADPPNLNTFCRSVFFTVAWTHVCRRCCSVCRGQKNNGGPAFCELEHVPPSHLESSWQQHQTFMRAMEKSVKDSMDPGIENTRLRQPACALAGLMGLISASSSSRRSYGTLFGCGRCFFSPFFEVSCYRVPVSD